MEAFRYITSNEWQQINEAKALQPKNINGDFQPIYAIPEDPLLWGSLETWELIRWIENVSGQEVSTLIKIDIPRRPDFRCFVQEGALEPWLKKDTRKHVTAYRREEYALPELVFYEEIPISEVSKISFY